MLEEDLVTDAGKDAFSVQALCKSLLNLLSRTRVGLGFKWPPWYSWIGYYPERCNNKYYLEQHKEPEAKPVHHTGNDLPLLSHDFFGSMSRYLVRDFTDFSVWDIVFSWKVFIIGCIINPLHIFSVVIFGVCPVNGGAPNLRTDVRRGNGWDASSN